MVCLLLLIFLTLNKILIVFYLLVHDVEGQFTRYEISYDAIYKRTRFLEDYKLGTQNELYDVLTLYNQNVQYIYNLKTKVCEKTTISDKWIE